MQLAAFQPVDAGAAVPDDGAGPIAEEDAHGLDADLAVEPRGTVGPDEPLPQGGDRGIETEPAVV